MASSPSPPSLLSQLNAVSENITPEVLDDVSTRAQLQQTVRKLSRALETPGDIMRRIALQFMETAVVKIAIDLDLFHILTAKKEPRSLVELVEITKVEAVLLGRILRYLVAVDAVAEVGEEIYGPTKVSRALTDPKLAAGVEFNFTFLSPVWNRLPSYLAETAYQTPLSPTQTVLQAAHKTSEPYYDAMASRPDILRLFNLYMDGTRKGRKHWLEYFPFEKELGEGFCTQDLDAIILVDVGGGRAQETMAVRKRLPGLPGRMVLQDLPGVIAQAELGEGVEAMGHDFFNPQPIKGARSYYLRSVLHNWPDTKCQIILSQIREAMRPGYSYLLINEYVVPANGVTQNMAHRDMNMMAILAAMERTEKQWYELLESVGLKVVKIWTPNDGVSESIIVASV